MSTDPALLSDDEVFQDYLEGELEREGRRRDSIDSRSVGSASSSAAVLAFGVAVVSLRREPSSADPSLGFWVFVAAFLVSVVAAGVATMPRWQDVGDIMELTRRLRRRGCYDREVVARYCAQARTAALRSLREGNAVKVRYLLAAQVLQGVGICALIVALWPGRAV